MSTQEPAPDLGVITDGIRELAAKHFKVDPATLSPATNFRDDLRADSLDLVLLVHEVEERFHVVVGQEDLVKVKTLADAVEIVARSPRSK